VNVYNLSRKRIVFTMLSKTDLAEFKERLLVLQARLRGDVQQLTDEALAGQEGGAESKSPTHIAELGTDAYEQDFSLRFVENEQETLEEIRAALKKIHDGTYGICEMCAEEGKPTSKTAIPKMRLRAIPYVRNCVQCERKREELSL
jgi:DnaK suppressor protein